MSETNALGSKQPFNDAALTRWPASDAQVLWCESAAAGALSPRFILVGTVRWAGPINVDIFTSALSDVVNRHEILRTQLRNEGGIWVQVVHPPTAATVQYLEATAGAVESSDEAAGRLCREASTMELDPTQLPLLQARIDRVGDDDFVISVLTHHTAADEISFALILRDLGEFYRDRCSGVLAQLPAAPLFGEFAAAQRRLVEGETGQAHREHWHRLLAGAPLFTLPTDRPIPPGRSLRYLAHTFELSEAAQTAVPSLAARHRATINMVLLAGLIAFAAETRPEQPDPVINTISAGRFIREFRQTVGPMLNFIPVRVGAERGDSIATLLEKTRTACLAAYAHELPVHYLEQAIPSLTVPLADPSNCDFSYGYFGGDRPSSPLGENVVNVSGDDQAALQIPGGLVWNMRQRHDGSLGGRVLFSPEVFRESTIVDWTTRFVEILTTTDLA